MESWHLFQERLYWILLSKLNLSESVWFSLGQQQLAWLSMASFENEFAERMVITIWVNRQENKPETAYDLPGQRNNVKYCLLHKIMTS